MALNLTELEQELQRAVKYNKATFTLDTQDMQELVRLAKLGSAPTVTQQQVHDYAYGAD